MPGISTSLIIQNVQPCCRPLVHGALVVLSQQDIIPMCHSYSKLCELCDSIEVNRLSSYSHFTIFMCLVVIACSIIAASRVIPAQAACREPRWLCNWMASSLSHSSAEYTAKLCQSSGHMSTVEGGLMPGCITRPVWMKLAYALPMTELFSHPGVAVSKV